MLTSSQQLALNTSHHLSVTANAGSGKTRVLVERYIEILTSGKAFVSEVVALTFTDKAASELRKRISEGVARKIAEETDQGKRDRLETIREQLAGAMIGTIHWFCKKILQEYPVEANVDASFTVVEGVDRKMLIEQSIKETFRSILNDEPYTAKREELFRVLRALGKPAVLRIVEQLVEHRELVQRWIGVDGLYSQPDDVVLARWRTHLSETVNNEVNDPQLLKDLRDLVDAASGRDALTVSVTYKAFIKTTEVNKRLLLLNELLAKLLTEGKLRKKLFGNKAVSLLAAQAERLKKADDVLSSLLTFVAQGNDDEHRLLLSQTRLLLELYQNVTERYAEKKFESAQLDFDDLQFHASELLRNDRVRKRLSQRFKYIMVDEYQDTNRLQYEILLPLVDNLARGNLFIVGDPKQSIYGFRNADVAVFERTKHDISGIAGTTSSVVLNDSFRLLRDIVAFVNLVFTPLMTAKASEYDVAYEPLVRGRQNNASGSVELLLRDRVSNGDKGEDDGTNPVSEGECIARRILQLHAERHEIFDKNEISHPIQFRDIAILIRSRNGLGDIEEALIRHNIPYIVSSGVGYFQTQGIYDFYNYFCFLLNPDNDVALAGVLRSPFFNVSDAELFEAGFGRRVVSLWDEIRSQRVAQKRLASLTNAIELLNVDLEIAARLPIAELVERIIAQTGYAGFVASTNRATQIMANIEKLKRLARRYEEQGFKTLYDFVGRLRRLIDEEEQEGQATIDVLADAVKIMTIHAAKGLEFPVVILPGLDRRVRDDSQPFLDEELGVAFSAGESERNPLAEFLKRRSYQKTVAEEKRILYVACTRARDMLILSGELPKNRSTKNHLNWLLDGLGLDDEIPDQTLRFQVSTSYLEVAGDSYVRKASDHLLHIKSIRPNDLTGSERVDTPIPHIEQSKRLLLDPLSFAPRGEMFSASKIRTYVECPAEYYLRYVAGLPTSNRRQVYRAVDDEQDVTIPAELRGRAFHHLMQHIDELTIQPAALREELSSYLAQDSLSIISEPSIELDAIVNLVMNVTQSKFWNEVKRGTETHTEFTVMSRLGDNFLTGTMDRIYRDEKGVWNIVDYKTDAVVSSELKKKAQTYEAQLQFYALLIQKYFAADQVRAVLLFTALCDSPVWFSYSGSDMRDFEVELASTITRIHAREFQPGSGVCISCPFSPTGCSNLLR